jgi:hypothetical protein
MSEKKKPRHLFCRCGCGTELPRDGEWRKYSRAVYVTGHNVPIRNKVSLIDKTKDNRKNQTGFLAAKRISNIRKDAIKAGYKWELDDLFVYEKMTGDCVYCGKPSGWPNSRNGIDRIDSSVGYVVENCVSCCRACNGAKSNQTTDDFYLWVKRIYINLLKNGFIEKEVSHG